MQKSDLAEVQVKIFKNSGVVTTELLSRGGLNFVRRTVPAAYHSKLHDQFNWYKKFGHLEKLPRILDFNQNVSSSYMDIEYISDSDTFSDFCLKNDGDICRKYFLELMEYVQNTLHQQPVQNSKVEPMRAYLAKKMSDKISQVAHHSPEFKNFLSYKEIVVNDVTLPNFQYLFSKLFEAGNGLSETAQLDCSLHGDLTLENVLIGPRGLFLIDPNPENISSPLVDYAKILQSLDSCYELHLAKPQVKVEGNTISFPNLKSEIYNELLSCFWKNIENNFTAADVRLLHFHQALHLARLLPYLSAADRNVYWVFYGELLRKLNIFLNS